jgi:hypothetical protein
MSDARRFIDRYGFSWQVCELWSPVERGLARGLADGAPTGNDGWLYFFSRGTTLVLRDYPPAWDELGWMELERLLERAQVLGSDTTIRLSRPLATALGAGDDVAVARV